MTGILIQCRLLSNRLPCKALLDLNGKTLLARVIERMQLTNLPVYVVTSNSLEDDLVECEARKSGITDVFRGSLLNVRHRFLSAALHFNLRYVVRVTADNPFSDPRLILTGLDYLFHGARYVRANQSYCPYGTNVELFDIEELEISEKNDPELLNTYDAEHVTPQIIERLKQTDKFIEFIPDIYNSLLSNDYRLSIDTPEDYIRIRKLYKYLSSNDLASIDLLDRLIKNLQNSSIDLA